MHDNTDTAAGDDHPRRLYYFNAGFLRQKRVRRILSLAGYDLRVGKPQADDLIAVWGRSPYAARGEAVAQKTGAGVIRIEDALLRSLKPGRSGEPPLGLQIDRTGIHFDANHPSDLETLLATHPFDDTALLNRARGAMARMREAGLSKYFGHDPAAALPKPGYVLVVDQTKGDASVEYGRADANSFREALYYAQEENPGARVLIKTHPETLAGFRSGYFSEDDANARVEFFAEDVNPWLLLEGAVGVYVVSSGLGFEAILAGHKPVVFGQPFYAGWGLTDDRNTHPLPRRGRNLTRAQLFAGAMLLHPVWYDPYRDQICELEEAMEAAAALAREWREDGQGWTGEGIRLWKRRPMQNFFGRYKRMRFSGESDRKMVWAGKADPSSDVFRVEDGFLRSRGLGAELVPPLSLVLDGIGIYYDPSRESRLEQLIAARAQLRPDQEARAKRLIRRLTELGVSKYNLGGSLPELPEGHRILVPGQVEDDASIRAGAGKIASNLALLQAARDAYPDAVILYKPHPDVEAGLRKGAIPRETALQLADQILDNADPIQLLSEVQEVFTMTSLLGFEALLRGVKVSCTGAPFYAGWGLTRDLGTLPARRNSHPSLAGLAHAALIDYPRYLDPVSGLACPVEVVVERLARGEVAHPGLVNRFLSKLQGVFAGFAPLWR
ncbi:capsular polysaccharide biosynthesis protein [Rhodalgimonas zhirmunskyi]|uniref:Capsular polysaccharide biosynthesis protein n=1 Tax=Rhodalgimonas zhirmunskyi TaxID=2964767 RepID=A0AAJ1X573_9RHOB|nr:capsular polysaccharide biosynthesis protein [Rhodoalgimonas zhirmunskyi]MDQ2093249.1 capsular polysaccharide biosynthesis protein [Rhodoalgimonas zhirmunskyi]